MIKILLSGKQILGTVTKIERIVFKNIGHWKQQLDTYNILIIFSPCSTDVIIHFLCILLTLNPVSIPLNWSVTTCKQIQQQFQQKRPYTDNFKSVVSPQRKSDFRLRRCKLEAFTLNVHEFQRYTRNKPTYLS